MQKRLNCFLIILCLGLMSFPFQAMAGLSITSITPSTVDNWGVVKIGEIGGEGFSIGDQITLRRNGQSDIEVLAIVESTSKIVGIIDAQGAETGNWDVVVTNQDGESATLSGGITLNESRISTALTENPSITFKKPYLRIKKVYSIQ